MLEKFNMKLLGSAFVVIVLLCAGIHFYAQWSNKRFASELGILSQPTAVPESAEKTENDAASPIAKASRVERPEFVNQDSSKDESATQSELSEVSEQMDAEEQGEETETSEPAAGFDAAPLLSAFGLPEEVTTLFEGGADAEDFEEAEAYLVEEYGQFAEVEAIIDRLKALSRGPVELDELTGLFEAWIQVLPPDAQENRRQLMNVLAQLEQVKALGGYAIVNIEGDVIDGNTSGD